MISIVRWRLSNIPAALAAVSLTSASLEADDPAQELDDEDGPK